MAGQLPTVMPCDGIDHRSDAEPGAGNAPRRDPGPSAIRSDFSSIATFDFTGS
jgi:hypothetical protein